MLNRNFRRQKNHVDYWYFLGTIPVLRTAMSKENVDFFDGAGFQIDLFGKTNLPFLNSTKLVGVDTLHSIVLCYAMLCESCSPDRLTIYKPL